MDYYINKIKSYCEQYDLRYVEIKKKKCIKLVFNLLIHNIIPKTNYNNDIWYFYLGRYYYYQKDYENMKNII